MSKKQRPRLDRFFSKIKTLLVTSPRTHVIPPSASTRRAIYVQMEFELRLNGKSE